MSSDLQSRLERLARIVVEEVEDWERRTRGRRQDALDQLTRTVEDKIQDAFERGAKRRKKREEERERKKREKREKRRERELQSASMPGGIVLLVAALVCLAFSVLRPELWWMVFVALGFGLGGAQQLHLAGQRRRASRGEADRIGGEQAPVDRHEVDLLCDALLADLKQSPESVRSFLKKPEATIESLRATCKALDARRQQLSREGARLSIDEVRRRRAELVERRDATKDPETRARLEQAVSSLETQAHALEQLKLAADRIDGEYTSLFVLLQELRTRVAIAKSAGTPPQLEGLKQNVQRLNVELEAISEALETAGREPVAPIAPLASEAADGGDAAASGGSRRRERS